jgi:hypothetical protein
MKPFSLFAALSLPLLVACPTPTDGKATVDKPTTAAPAPATKAPAAAPASKPAAQPINMPTITEPVLGGPQTQVADLFAKKAELAGKPVTVVGNVVKFNANIMGTNWLHVQDGSGAAGTNDITVTTKDAVAVGDQVKVEGAVAVSRDFGMGYKFDVMIENAKVAKQ